MKKKLLASLTALLLALGLMSPAVFADDTATVYVTIANGDLKMVQQPVTVTDVSGALIPATPSPLSFGGVSAVMLPYSV